MIDSTEKTTCPVCNAPLNIYFSMGMKFEEPCKQCMLNTISDRNANALSADENLIEGLSDRGLENVINQIYGANPNKKI